MSNNKEKPFLEKKKAKVKSGFGYETAVERWGERGIGALEEWARKREIDGRYRNRHAGKVTHEREGKKKKSHVRTHKNIHSKKKKKEKKNTHGPTHSHRHDRRGLWKLTDG